MPMRALPLVRLISDPADRFEMRGVYVPGRDTARVRPWREFGWLLTSWLLGVTLFVLILALAT